jgi:hypothetical protein
MNISMYIINMYTYFCEILYKKRLHNVEEPVSKSDTASKTEGTGFDSRYGKVIFSFP